MRKGHAHLKGLNDSHFDAVMENLGATLTELSVPGHLIAQAAAIAAKHTQRRSRQISISAYA